MPPPILSAIVLASWAWGMPIHGDGLGLAEVGGDRQVLGPEAERVGGVEG